MKDQTRYILDKGKAENCSTEEKQYMLALFHRQESEFMVKEKLREDLSAETTTPFVIPDINVLFNKLWEKIGHFF